MSFLDVIFPKRCVGCGRIGRYFCSRCISALPLIAVNEAICPMCGGFAMGGRTHPRCRTRYGLDGLTSFFRYTGVIRRAIKSMKYRLVSDLAHDLVSIVPEQMFRFWELSSGAIIVPVPLHVTRERDRGFNQAEVIGRELGMVLHIPMQTDMLRRTKQTAPQVALSNREERLINMKGIFAVTAGYKRAMNILLVDDVFTTGATLRSAAATLKRAGTHTVWGVTLAR